MGAIRGPSSQLPDEGRNAAAVRNDGIRWNETGWVGSLPVVEAPPAAGARGGRGAPADGGRGRGGARGGAGANEDAGGFTVQDGFRKTRVAMMIAYAKLDPGFADAQMPASAMAIHDELCLLEGPNATDGVGHCPTMLIARDTATCPRCFRSGATT
jgi:hypothetical protein